MDITGHNKAVILAALYNDARPQGMGLLHYDPKPMTTKEAQAILDKGITDFDYLKGRVMKVNLSGDFLDTRLYNRDNGQGAAEYAVLDALTRPD